MAITTEQVKDLRERTGVSVMQCKKALEEANGDMDKAILFLRKKSGEIAAKKSDRTLGAGAVSAYIHGNGSVGVLLELSCETDFVSKNEEFRALAYDIAMHAAAMNPEATTRDEISGDKKDKIVEVINDESKDELKGKPEDIKKKILEGKLSSYYKDKVLLEQSFIKNPEQTIQDLITTAIQKFGEKIEITRFVRYSTIGK